MLVRLGNVEERRDKLEERVVKGERNVSYDISVSWSNILSKQFTLIQVLSKTVEK